MYLWRVVVRRCQLGETLSETLSARQLWRTCINASVSNGPHTLITEWNVSTVSAHHRPVSLAIYARRRAQPTHVRFDFIYTLHTATSVGDVTSPRHSHRHPVWDIHAEMIDLTSFSAQPLHLFHQYRNQYIHTSLTRLIDCSRETDALRTTDISRRSAWSRADRREHLHDSRALYIPDVGFSTFGGDIFRGLQMGDQQWYFCTICLQRSFRELRHMRCLLVWPCHSSVDVVYCVSSSSSSAHVRY